MVKKIAREVLDELVNTTISIEEIIVRMNAEVMNSINR